MKMYPIEKEDNTYLSSNTVVNYMWPVGKPYGIFEAKPAENIAHSEAGAKPALFRQRPSGCFTQGINAARIFRDQPCHCCWNDLYCLKLPQHGLHCDNCWLVNNQQTL